MLNKTNYKYVKAVNTVLEHFYCVSIEQIKLGQALIFKLKILKKEV